MANKVWKRRDEELFTGIPSNGQCAPARDGDLADLLARCIHERFDQHETQRHRYAEYQLDDYRTTPPPTLPTRAKYFPDDVARSIRQEIEYRISKPEDPFYIGRLPPVKQIKIGTSVDLNAPRSVEKDIYLDYFAYTGAQSWHLDQASESLRKLRGYIRHPFVEFMHIICRLLLAAFTVLQVVLAANELPDYHGFLHVAQLPLFYTGGETGFLFWHALGWFVLGLLPCLISLRFDHHYDEPLGDTGMLLVVGHFFVSAGHALSALRTPFLSQCAAALLIVLELIFLLVYVKAFFMLLIRFFKRIRRKKRIPADYSPDFIKYADLCYRYCRLHILWYENATGKKAPRRFYDAIHDMEKLDRRYNKMLPVYERLTGKKA